MKLLDGKVAIVTGGGRGVGRAEALSLAAHGARVVVNATSGSADEVANEIVDQGGEAIAVRASVADYDDAGRLVDAALRHFGRLDILVNNAGTSLQKLLHEIEPAEWQALMAINLNGHFFTTQHAAKPMMAQRSGRIINTCAGSWRNPTGNLAYGVSKAGIVTFTWGVAWELRGYGITCNAIAPFGKTQLTERSAQAYERLIEAGVVPAGKNAHLADFPGPEFAAPIVTYLASDRAADITGLVIRTGGGKLSVYTHPEERNLILKPVVEGAWTMEELIERVPSDLLRGVTPWWSEDTY